MTNQELNTKLYKKMFAEQEKFKQELYDEKNTFDIEKFLNRKAKLYKGEVFTVIDGDAL